MDDSRVPPALLDRFAGNEKIKWQACLNLGDAFGNGLAQTLCDNFECDAWRDVLHFLSRSDWFDPRLNLEVDGEVVTPLDQVIGGYYMITPAVGQVPEFLAKREQKRRLIQDMKRAGAPCFLTKNEFKFEQARCCDRIKRRAQPIHQLYQEDPAVTKAFLQRLFDDKVKGQEKARLYYYVNAYLDERCDIKFPYADEAMQNKVLDLLREIAGPEYEVQPWSTGDEVPKCARCGELGGMRDVAVEFYEFVKLA